LGRVKFVFPNPFDVYLHDTPSRQLFSKSLRTFSSGCIRIQKPVELGEYLLRDRPEWTREQIEAAFLTEKQQTVRLSQPIPVHLLYWTAWVTNENTVHFRKDVYGRDKRLSEVLASEHARSAIQKAERAK
jgi:murein L,D-transpeptidase YcbB/YkuD